MTRVAAALIAALLFGALPLAAQTPSLTIDNVATDTASGTLTIAGRGFGTRPFVTLDLVPLNIQLALEQRIVVVAPLGRIPAGTYVLTVTRGAQPGDTGSTDVRIGADTPAVASPAQPSASTPVASAGAAGPLPGASDAAARVGDRTITMADVDREWQRVDPVGYLTASRQGYQARRRVVTDLVNNELLAKEAAARGVSVDALLKEAFPKRSVPLPDNSLTTLYQSLGSRVRGATLDQMRPALREWLARKIEPDLAKMTYLEELTKVSTRADIFMLPPAVAVMRAADDPSLGPEAAPVDVVLFGDFQNPAYARNALTIPRVREMFGNRVRFTFKHFPANDSASIAAAEAAACANAQGKFWAFHDTLLGEAGALDSARFKRVAAVAGADGARFDTCLDTGAMRDRIGQALEETRHYDIAESGAILINGRLAPDAPAFLPPFEYFKRLIEEELARQSRQGRD